VLIEYRLRVSHWARGVTLRVTDDARIEVVAPRRIGARTIARILGEHREWIATALGEAQARHCRPAPPTIPLDVLLPAIGGHWTLTREPTQARGVRIRHGDNELVLTGQVSDAESCRRALRRWLVGLAWDHLLPWLENVSYRHAIPYGRCAVRLTRAQWGCCYRSGLITLSARLLFLPPPVVEYILVHELCHTKEQNHSAAFWCLVARYCPEFKLRRADLRRLAKSVPGWVAER
jgi:predicted metal-dependent hydrolase